MKIGIGLPDSIPGVGPTMIIEWAIRADQGPFTTIGTEDRLIYPNYDSLVTLAAAAAVTKRVRLITNILIAPLRNAGVLAKQASTIDLLSGGRLTLGLAVGSRETDYRAAPADFKTRGRRFDEMLVYMKRIWTGEPLADDIPNVGPLPVQPGGPEVLIGGQVERSAIRAGQLADGYIGGNRDPFQASKRLDTVRKVWAEAGRSGEPRFVADLHFALGPGAAEKAEAYARAYFAYRGAGVTTMIGESLLTPDAIRASIDSLAIIGMDEIIFIPDIADFEQIDRLADAIA
jgi:alkanesulfonate monooxygenase SsuD/methylene tetrahydromethanopterin reductase-like flavin-dependent oxidoreductase (luciferase family)